MLGQQLKIARGVNVNPIVCPALRMIERPEIHRTIHLAVCQAHITMMIGHRDFLQNFALRIRLHQCPSKAPEKIATLISAHSLQMPRIFSLAQDKSRRFLNCLSPQVWCAGHQWESQTSRHQHQDRFHFSWWDFLCYRTPFSNIGMLQIRSWQDHLAAISLRHRFKSAYCKPEEIL